MGEEPVSALREVGVLLSQLKEPEPPKGFKDALEKLPKESGLADVNPMSIRRALERQFDIGYVHAIQPSDILVKPVGAYYNVTAKYDDRKHLFYNVDVVMSFDKTVKVPRN